MLDYKYNEDVISQNFPHFKQNVYKSKSEWENSNSFIMKQFNNSKAPPHGN